MGQLSYILGQQRGFVNISRIYHLQLNTNNSKIKMQFCGDIRWNHIICDVNEGRFVSKRRAVH